MGSIPEDVEFDCGCRMLMGFNEKARRQATFIVCPTGERCRNYQLFLEAQGESGQPLEIVHLSEKSTKQQEAIMSDEDTENSIRRIMDAMCKAAGDLLPAEAQITVIVRMKLDKGATLQLIQSSEVDPSDLVAFVADACSNQILDDRNDEEPIQ